LLEASQGGGKSRLCALPRSLYAVKLNLGNRNFPRADLSTVINFVVCLVGGESNLNRVMPSHGNMYVEPGPTSSIVSYMSVVRAVHDCVE
jgi:hypothetical protein